MIRQIILILILMLLITSCGARAATQAPAATEAPATEARRNGGPPQPKSPQRQNLPPFNPWKRQLEPRRKLRKPPRLDQPPRKS